MPSSLPLGQKAPHKIEYLRVPNQAAFTTAPGPPPNMFLDKCQTYTSISRCIYAQNEATIILSVEH